MTDRIYFVCVGNSCRSQMAEGFARTLGGDEVEVASGGTEPATRVHPHAVAVMREAGIDISDQKPEPIDESRLAGADRVVSMGCGVEESCPAPLYDGMVDWDLDDPVGQPIETFRRIRDEIESRVRDLLGRSKGDPAPPGEER